MGKRGGGTRAHVLGAVGARKGTRVLFACGEVVDMMDSSNAQAILREFI